MLESWIILLNISIAGFVGGMTNHIAIKMLFHPRTEKRIWGYRIPFTPGLIPSRRNEITRSLGRVVSEYLVTSQGMTAMLEKKEMHEKVTQWLIQLIEKWTSREETVRELLQQWLAEERLEEMEQQTAQWLSARTEQLITHVWEKQELGKRKLSELVPNWSLEKRSLLVDQAVKLIGEELSKELLSFNGERLIKQLTSQFMAQSSGFLGALAGMFMDEAKMVEKIRVAVLTGLRSPQFRTALADMLHKKIGELEQMPLERLIEQLSGEADSLNWMRQQSDRLIPWKAWMKQVEQLSVQQLLSSSKPHLLQFAPHAAQGILNLLATNIEKMMQAIDLPKLVEREVGKFPVEQVEEIILSIVGKEFRAITWLGVLLGGIIGLIQSLLIPFYR